MEYMKLYECAIFSDKRTKDINKETYISTENMLPYKGGITITESLPNCLSASKYEPHDVLLSNIRPYFQKIWYADRIGSCSNDVLVLKSNGKVDSKFLYYVLSDKTFFDYDTLTSKGTKMPRGTKNAIMKYIVPDVTLSIQRKIASILSAYDSLIENNTKRIRLLEQMAENLYKEWFVRFRFPGYENTEFVNGLPKGWMEFVAKDRYSITIGKTPPRKEFHWFTKNCQNACKWVSISDMKEMFTRETDEQLTNDAVKKFNMVVVPKGTILLSFKLTVGRITIASYPMCTNEAIAHFKGVPKNENEYLYWQLKKYDYRKLGNTSAIGNAINSKIVRDMKLVLPSADILNLFSSYVSCIHQQIDSLQRQFFLLTRQRDLLLPRLMSGKLEVKSIKE